MLPIPSIKPSRCDMLTAVRRGALVVPLVSARKHTLLSCLLLFALRPLQNSGWGKAGYYTTCVKCKVPNCKICSAPGDKCEFCLDGFGLNRDTNECVAEADIVPCEERKCDQCNSLYFFSSGDDCTSCGKDRVCQRWRSSTKLRLTGLRLARCEVFCELEWAVLGGQISALQNK